MSQYDINEFDFSGAEGATVAKEANKGGDGFAKEVEFLMLKADDASVAQGKNQAIVRLVTEHERKPWMTANSPHALPWITVKQHYAPTRQRPTWLKEGARWPEKMYAVCRKDKVFAKKYGDQCLICDQGVKASDRTWALGIEREQVIENGRVLGIRDKTREVTEFGEDGKPVIISQDSNGENKVYKKKVVPAWVVLNFGWKNFFNALNGQAGYFMSVLGRDFVIQRTGTGNNDTTYSFIPLDPITITGQWATDLGVPDGTPYDMGATVAEVDGRPVPLSELLYPDMPDLRRIVAERTSSDYYGRWFDPNWAPEGAQNQQGSAPASGGNGVQTGYVAPATPVTPQPEQAGGAAPAGPTPNALDVLRARVSGGGVAAQ